MLVTIEVGSVELVGESSLRIHVVDRGMGICREHLERIFDHGFTTKEKGHGFGLRASRATAESLGGSLEVYSEGTGKGATATLVVPYSLDKFTL